MNIRYELTHGFTKADLTAIGFEIPAGRLDETFYLVELGFKHHIGAFAQSGRDGFYAYFIKPRNDVQIEDENIDSMKKLAITYIVETCASTLKNLSQELGCGFSSNTMYKKTLDSVFAVFMNMVSNSLVDSAVSDDENERELLGWRIFVAGVMGENTPEFYKKALNDILAGANLVDPIGEIPATEKIESLRKASEVMLEGIQF
ncbi:hypothetical protein [Hydrogenimonas sp.]